MLLVVARRTRPGSEPRRGRAWTGRGGRRVPDELLGGEGRHEPVRVPYEVEGRSEALYLSPPGELAAYEELRAGFTAAVSHELRTPLARLLALLETASLPGQDTAALVEQARAEVEHIRELIDDILFLSELETGRAVVALGSTRALPVVEEVLAGFGRPRTAPASPSGRKAIPRLSCRFDRACCGSSSRTSPRTRSATRAPERSRSPSPAV